MFTTQGKNNLLRTVADSGLITHMALGIGTTAAALTDSRLDAEVLRLPILSATPDYVNNVIIYKATIPAETAIDVYEVGLVNNPVSTHTMVTDFTEPTFWTNTTSSTSNARVEGSTALIAPPVSTLTSTVGNVSLVWADADEMVFSYFVGSNIASLTVHLRTDASNYYYYGLPVTAGYRIVRVPRSSFLVTGTPGAINNVVFNATASAGGAGQVFLDSMQMVDTADREPDMVIRRVLGANVNKPVGIARDFEYTVAVSGT